MHLQKLFLYFDYQVRLGDCIESDIELFHARMYVLGFKEQNQSL